MTSPVSWEPIVIATGDRDIRGRIYRPESDLGTPGDLGNTIAPQARSGEPGVLVWAHGGSWRAGSVAEWHPALAHLASLTGATVVGVDYRLAPRHPHPAPLLDVLAALDWAAGIADGAPVAVGGDSAGATLAAAAALVRRDTGRSPAAQVLAYPPVDPACGAASYRRDPAAFPRRADLAAAWRAYRGDRGPDAGHYSTPADAADVSGAAPAALVVGTLDPVVDDVRAYAARLAAAGVPAALHELPGTGHGAFLGSPEFRRRLAAAYLATLHAHTPVVDTPVGRTSVARISVARTPDRSAR
ncbi:alpha/beta hydrolase fold domain-containing protein [Yinghuangia sp. YIM S09857]|uniref:alpha/beta hydrolase fold domain-containing protein n=1 Tax=Yinghuangia sp. YIM S09857 TaxID=3436929 RepID=UPI003F5298BB